MPSMPRSASSSNDLPQIGRRPPNPSVPMLSGLMWVVVGVVILVAFRASWHVVVGIVCIGIGALFVRGGVVAARRQTRR